MGSVNRIYIPSPRKAFRAQCRKWGEAWEAWIGEKTAEMQASQSDGGQHKRGEGIPDLCRTGRAVSTGSMSDSRESPRPDRAALRSRWLRLSLVLWVGFSIVYGVWIGPYLTVFKPDAGHFLIPTGPWAIVASAAPAFAAGLLLAIYTLSPLPHRVLFQPTRARVLVAAGFWLVFPVAVIGLFPVSAGYAFFRGLGLAGQGQEHWSSIPVALSPLLITYAAACLLCSGLPGWRRRSLALALVWGACLSVASAAGLWLFHFGPL